MAFSVFLQTIPQIFYSISANDSLRGARSAALGENTTLAAIHGIGMIAFGIEMLSNSPFISSPVLNGVLSFIGTANLLNFGMIYGHDTGYIKFDVWEEARPFIDKVLEGATTFIPIAMFVHSIALYIFKNSIPSLAFAFMSVALFLQSEGMLRIEIRKPFEDFVSFLRHFAPLFNPMTLVKIIGVNSILGSIFDFFALTKLPFDQNIPSNPPPPLPTVNDILFNAGANTTLRVNTRHLILDPAPDLGRGEPNHMLSLFDTLFVEGSESLVLLERGIRRHKDWEKSLQDDPELTELKLARTFLEKLIWGIENESLPEGFGFSYRYIQNQLRLINQNLPTLRPEEAATVLSRLILESGNYCASGPFNLVGDIADGLALSTPNDLARKILLILQDFRFYKALDLVEMGIEMGGVGGIYRIFGEQGDQHRAALSLQTTFRYFGLPERGIFEDRTLVDTSGALQTINSLNIIEILLRAPGFYDVGAILDRLESHPDNLRADLLRWAARNPTLHQIYSQVTGEVFDEDNFNIWIDREFNRNMAPPPSWYGRVESPQRLSRFLTLYLLELGVFEVVT